MSARFITLGLDDALGRQIQSDLRTAYPQATIDSGTVPEDPQAVVKLSAYDAVLLGYDHARAERDGAAGPQSLLAPFRGSGALVLLLARGGNELTAVDALRCGAADYIPVRLASPRLLAERISAALRARSSPVGERRRSQVRRTAQADELPTSITGYRVMQTLAQSDRSAVYVAQSQELGFNVALKVLRRAGDSADTQGELSRFEREYQIISQLRHRAIVDVYDFGNAEGVSYIATEYFPAGDLKTRLRNPMSSEEAVAYVRQIAEALQAIHAAGVLHRDLKPANVMLRNDNSIVLIDFGLAKELAGDKALTGAGEIRGSPYYMSPEQAAGQPTDERTDLYSLGVIFHELLTGERPFQGNTVFEILAGHQHAPAPRLAGDVARFQPLLDRLLAKAPADRFQTATEFLHALKGLNPVTLPTS
ncbi:MAG TPA: protein kinase [Steroidobacteraceae bacterium]|nr:protein kinase [Steroidobacteraceae bacterium]